MRMPQPWVALVSGVATRHVDAFLTASKGLVRLEIVDPSEIGVDLLRDRLRLRRRGTALPPYDAAIFRRVSPHGSFDFQIQILREWERILPVAINKVDPMLMAMDKLAVAVRLQEAGLPIPATVAVPDSKSAEELVRREGLAVAKPVFGSMGEGIQLWRDVPDLRRIIAEYLHEYGAVLLQEFVPSGGRDVRVFVVGRQAIAACTRTAQAGEWRTNIAQGGIPDLIEVTPELARLAVGAAEAVGLDYTGVDLIEGPSGWKVLEVNGSPSFLGLSRATGKDMARIILEYVVKKIEQARIHAAA